MSDVTPTPVPTVTHFGEHVRLELHPLDPRIASVVLDRPERRNAVDRSVANALRAAFEAFDADASLAAAVLWGAGGTFCAGADLKLELPQGSSAAHRFGAVVDPVVRKKRMDSGVDGDYAFIDSQHAC
jgi:enoyl-CoA hydratase/carnithine racemase